MASRSSRPKSGSSVALEHAAVLLEGGRQVENPPPELLAAAKRLEPLGLIRPAHREYVLCAEPRDRDFPPRNRHCRGRIYLDSCADEDGAEFRCPKCERPVYPFRYGKLRHPVLDVHVRQDGVLSYLGQALAKVDAQVRDLGQGAFLLPNLGQTGVSVYVVDLDGPANHKFNDQNRAASEPTCFVTVNPRAFEGRFCQEEWLCRVSLAELLAGRVDLAKALARLAEAPVPRSVSKAIIPVYAKGHVLVQPVEKPHPGRLFVVEFDEEVVRIEGEIVVNRQAGPRLAVFRILWRRFVEDILEQVPPDRFRATSLKELLDLMEKEEEKRYDDAASLRRVVNNLQGDIETAVKRKLGLPICREDIVQTCRTASQADADGGYRINPFSVALRPAQAR